MNLKKIDLNGTFKTARSLITANSPQLLVGAAVVGVISTGILAAKGGYKARGILDEERDRRISEVQPEMKFSDKVQLTWLCYAAPGVTTLSTIASVVALHGIHTKRHASVMALYAVSQGNLDDYREKAEELLGSKKTQQLNNALAQQSVDETPPGDYSTVVITGRGNELMQDKWSKQYFTSSIPEVEVAFAKLNGKLDSQGDASVNEYYDFLGIEPVGPGDRNGWSGTNVHPHFGTAMAKDGRSVVVVSFLKEPKGLTGVV